MPAPPAGQVVEDARPFYNDSAFDGNGLMVSAADENAIDTGKSQATIGQPITFASMTGYVKGLNGVTFLVAALPNDGANLTAADFAVLLGTTANINAWAPGPAPTVTVRANSGPNGEDRVFLSFPNHSIKDTYAAFQVLATPNTGLLETHTAIFGNVAGDTGTSFLNPLSHFGRDASDLQAEIHPAVFFLPAIVTAPTDVDKDGFTNAFDLQGTVTGGNFGQPPVINQAVLLVITPVFAPPAPGFAAGAAAAIDAPETGNGESAVLPPAGVGFVRSPVEDGRLGNISEDQRDLAFATFADSEDLPVVGDLLAVLATEEQLL